MGIKRKKASSLIAPISLLEHYYLSATMIKFLPLDFLRGSQRILGKNENAVYHLQIPALVPEIFNFEKCVKYANEITNNDARLILRRKLNGATT